jgi:hypothetical protein
MTMTRKDYVKVAEIFNKNKEYIHPEAFEDLIADFSDFFFEDNPNFSPARFEMACFGE